jgi:hypothetical protein
VDNNIKKITIDSIIGIEKMKKMLLSSGMGANKYLLHPLICYTRGTVYYTVP